MKKILVFLMMAALLTVSGGIASADLLFDRGLPTANLNNAAGADRSNVAWGFGYDPDGRWLAGDDFMIGGAGDYLVDTITIWTTTATDTSVWFGEEGGDFINYTPTATTLTTYSDGSDYQGSSGNFLSLLKFHR